MSTYYETFEQFMKQGGLKQSTITAKQLLPAVVAHMVRMDRKFSLTVNGRLPKSMTELLEEVFDLCHLQQPFYTQHCATRTTRYMNISKSRVKIEFEFTYRMPRNDEKWVLSQIQHVLQIIITPNMTKLEQVIAIHDYIVRNYHYEMNTSGSPFTVLTFMKEGQGVCMAYALLFQKMLELVQIPCYYVVGKADGESDLGHAWNMVQLDGQWFHVDATWNDLGSRTEKFEIRYTYFLRDDAFMKKDHHWNPNHYPPCTSDRFKVFQTIYDAAYVNGYFYYPSKTGALMKLCSETMEMTKVNDCIVQQIVGTDSVIYFSNYSDGGKLYQLDISTLETTKKSDERVKKLKQTLQQIQVTFETSTEILYEREAVQQDNAYEEIVEVEQQIPFMYLGDLWIGSYEGEMMTTGFTHELIQLEVQDAFSQLTVNVNVGKRKLDFVFTTNRKPVIAEKPIIIRIHSSLIKDAKTFTNSHGEELHYVRVEDFYQFQVQSNVMIHYYE